MRHSQSSAEHANPLERATHVASLALIVGAGALVVRGLKHSTIGESVTDYARQRAHELIIQAKPFVGRVIDFVQRRYTEFVASQGGYGEPTGGDPLSASSGFTPAPPESVARSAEPAAAIPAADLAEAGAGTSDDGPGSEDSRDDTGDQGSVERDSDQQAVEVVPALDLGVEGSGVRSEAQVLTILSEGQLTTACEDGRQVVPTEEGDVPVDLLPVPDAPELPLKPKFPVSEGSHNEAGDIQGNADAEIARKALIDEVAQAAKGRTQIYARPNIFGEIHPQPIGGIIIDYDSFPANILDRIMMRDIHYVEALLFEPALLDRYEPRTEEIATRRWFRQRPTLVTYEEPIREEATIINPITGEQEPAVEVVYQFDNRFGGYVRKDYPRRLPDGRMRQPDVLCVQSIIPKSVAERLREGVLDDPTLARDFARMMVLNEGIAEEVWNDRLAPPYDRLRNWNLAVTEVDSDIVARDWQRSLVSRQVVGISPQDAPK